METGVIGVILGVHSGYKLYGDDEEVLGEEPEDDSDSDIRTALFDESFRRHCTSKGPQVVLNPKP